MFLESLDKLKSVSTFANLDAEERTMVIGSDTYTEDVTCDVVV